MESSIIKPDCPVFDYKNWRAPKEVRNEKNRRKTKSLFAEMQQATQFKQYPAVYTLCEEPEYVYTWNIWVPSAKQIYLSCANEYDAALKLVGSIEHWNILLELDWFVNGSGEPCWTSLAQWREQLEQQKQARAEAILIKQADMGNVAAAKILYEGKSKRGRPSKDEIAGHLKKAARATSVHASDLDRINKIVKLHG